MYFKQFYLGCLAHASYLIGSEGEAAVVDPQRDVDQYIEEARSQGLAIKYVVETHLHADFVSGHRELAERTGADIVFGCQAGAAFPHRAVKDGDEIRIGKVSLRFLETPGHTPESISVLVADTAASDQPQKVLTGDTLFIGDVGRPDLAAGQNTTPQDMAGVLYDSLHQKLLTLPDQVEVYPAHGAGSLCGRNISDDNMSTIGKERRFNYALRIGSREEFIRTLTADLPDAPQYFSYDVQLNREGPRSLEEIPLPAALSPQAVQQRAQDGDIVLDTRSAAEFGTSHVPGAINIGLEGKFASWAGSFLDPKQPVIVVAENEGQVRETVTRLARVGLENVNGYLADGMYAWDKARLPMERLDQITVDELNHRLQERPGQLQVLDVRQPGEFEAGNIPGARNVPLRKLPQHLDNLDPQCPLAVNCAGGYRSSLAGSLLKRHGIRNIANVVGGFSAWETAGLPVERQGSAEPAPAT